jgi:hypothetical protein
MHWTVWTGRAVGKAFFRIRPLLMQLEMKPTQYATVDSLNAKRKNRRRKLRLFESSGPPNDVLYFFIL